MELTLNIIREKFDQVLGEFLSREAASDWARALREAHDRGEIVFKPVEDKRRIWNGLLFLEGVDLKDGPDSYLHIGEDIIRERP